MKPAMSVSLSVGERQLLIDSVERRDAAAVAKWLDGEYFLIEIGSDEENAFALNIEVDDIPAMVAFSSEENIQEFVNGNPEFFEEDSVSAFRLSTFDMLDGLPEGLALVIDPGAEDTVLIPSDLIAEAIPLVESRSLKVEDDPEVIQHPLRAESLAFLRSLGFKPVNNLPQPNLGRMLRPTTEIALRLLALGGLFCWASAPEDRIKTVILKAAMKSKGISKFVTADEREILQLPRSEAREQHCDVIGWRLENMWPLAWVLGYPKEPTLDATQIGGEIIRSLIFDFLRGMDLNLESLIRECTVRSNQEVIAMEDRFYCAHNAVRNAQLGRDTVPEGFHPVQHGGAVHERRHSLTWALSPGVAWDDTDLST
jgi:hypothetical protein